MISSVDNEPFGLALDAVFSPEDVHLSDRGLPERDRLFLLIHPHPDDPLGPWPRSGAQPVFGQSSLRAFNMQRSQSLYQDLLRLEKYNGTTANGVALFRQLGLLIEPKPRDKDDVSTERLTLSDPYDAKADLKPNLAAVTPYYAQLPPDDSKTPPAAPTAAAKAPAPTAPKAP